MSKNILIVYASYGGATAEIASKMKALLLQKNFKVDLMLANGSKTDLSKYDLIVLGAAIRGNTPHLKMGEFIMNNFSALVQKKTAVFAVCITITSVKESKRKYALTYPDKIAKGLSPVRTTVFAGIARSSGRFGNFMGKLILGIVPGDHRDWNKVEEWTLSLPEIL